MTTSSEQRFVDFTHAALRIAAGLTFFSHGAQKIFGWFGGVGPDGGTVDIVSWFGAAGIIEVVAGFCIVVGLFTQPLALLASGEMAVAYTWRHWGRSGDMWWWQNHGELALLYAFIWLLFAAWGAGPLSLEAWLDRRRAARDSMQSPSRSIAE